MIAEDASMVRGALVALLGLESDIKVVAEVASADEILSTAHGTQPDVTVIDIDLPGKIDGLTAAADLHQQLPGCKTLILSSLGRPDALRRALAASVSGFLLKHSPSDKLASAIRDISVGRRVVDSELALAVWDSSQHPLTNREIEVLGLAAAGADAVEIAGLLFLSAGTVRNYLRHVVTKLNARNRVDAIRIAREAGWL
jgi:two-component system response regulator DesR